MPSNVSIAGDDALTLDMVGQYTYCPPVRSMIV